MPAVQGTVGNGAVTGAADRRKEEEQRSSAGGRSMHSNLIRRMQDLLGGSKVLVPATVIHAALLCLEWLMLPAIKVFQRGEYSAGCQESTAPARSCGELQ